MDRQAARGKAAAPPGEWEDLTTHDRDVDSLFTAAIPVPFDELVRRVVEEHAARARQADVTVDLHCLPTTVEGDPLLLDRLTSNLVENAIKYNQPGGKAVVQVGTGPTLAVSNTGPHVPPGEVPRLCEPFRRLFGDRLGKPDRAWA